MGDSGGRLRVLQRFVMPLDRAKDVEQLYFDGRVARKNAGGRSSVIIAKGREVSFCTYFNAFPAAYWRRWSDLEEVQLRLRIRGEATVAVFRSTGKAFAQRIALLTTDDEGGGVTERRVTLPLEPFIDGGWYWFEITAGDNAAAVLEGAEWCAASDRPPGTTTIGITTFNRPGFCVDQLLALAGTDALEVIDEILVVDQGAKRVTDHPEFARAAEALGPVLRVIEQGNIGGSGGFSRAMAETLEAGRSDYVLLLDDDVVTEPEGILRAVAFADFARTPTIVGGHMFDLYNRSVLHAHGECVARYRWWMVPAPHTEYWHDLRKTGLRDTPWLHRRADADFNGWWMCLIPADVLRKIGLSLPFFIKWDDIEYGMRARLAGIPTVPLPGAAVWHIPWHSKDNDLDWQAYFQTRNRIVSALLHSPYERGGNMIKESLIMVTKHAYSMQYSTAEMMLLGIRDALTGPDCLHGSIVTKLPELKELRTGFTDARAKGRIEEFPAVKRQKPPRKGREEPDPPTGRTGFLRAAVAGSLRQSRRVKKYAMTYPETSVPHVDQAWWLLSKYDSALVSSADGTSVSWYQRDRRRTRSLLVRNAALHIRLYLRWHRLRTRYQRALPELVSPERWHETFEAAKGAVAPVASVPAPASAPGRAAVPAPGGSVAPAVVPAPADGPGL